MKTAARLALVLVAVWLLIWTRAFTRWPQVWYMTGPSMEPAVRAHEFFIATSPAGPPRHGDLVLFRYEDADGVFHVLRRVAGLPGDTVAMQDGIAVVNGQLQTWPLRIVVAAAWHSPLARVRNLYTWGPIVVPRDSVWLLADTRDIIGWPDSRFLGPVPLSAVEAEAGRIVWPPRRFLRKLQP
ncbi:MAG: signal peptidase I [Gemmatimonadales bacterium]|jgi:signal peptidase I